MVNPSGNGNGGYSAVRQLTMILFSRNLLESFLHLGSAFRFVSWLSLSSLRSCHSAHRLAGGTTVLTIARLGTPATSPIRAGR